jgi:hypothetical protein
MYSIGVDFHKAYSHMTVLDAQGQLLKVGKVPNRAEAVRVRSLSFAITSSVHSGISSPSPVDQIRNAEPDWRQGDGATSILRQSGLPSARSAIGGRLG